MHRRPGRFRRQEKKAMFHCNLLSALLALSAVVVTPVYSQQLRVLSGSVVSSRVGSYDWYDVEADLENAGNLITCGMRWDAQDNANYGFVYSSQDAGRTWQLAFEDKSSTWVSEESCAFGVHGVAYFVADASKVVDGDTQHEHGTSRIWVSRDAGRTWSLGTTTGWTDANVSIVDRDAGPNQNRLYTFFNAVDTYYESKGDKSALDRIPKLSEESQGGLAPGTAISLITYRDGDREVGGPIFDSKYKQPNHRSYPGQSLILKDGSLLTLFWMKRAAYDAVNKRTGTDLIFAAQRTDPRRGKLLDPVILNSFRNHTSECNSFLSAPAAYDATTNTVYAAYLDSSKEKCRLMLYTSTDSGETWSVRPWTEERNVEEKDGESTELTYDSLAIARNRDGVIALLWRNGRRSNCWHFAVSTDDAHTYSHPISLSSCSAESDRKYQLHDTYLNFGYVTQAEKSNSRDYVDLSINYQNRGLSHTSGIAVSPDGVFHPVWAVSSNNSGYLRTIAIAVVRPQYGSAAEPTPTPGWRYATSNVAFLYGGSQRYDGATRILAVSLVLRNTGAETLKVPLRLEIYPRSQLGLIYPLDATTEGSAQTIAQYLDISQYLPGGELIPGGSSAPIPLTFHFEPNNDVKAGDNMLAHI